MAALLKNMYNQESLKKVALDIQSVYPSFDSEGFLKAIMDMTWEGLELKARVRHISLNLGKYLPKDFIEATEIIDKVVANYTGFFGLFFPDFIEVYGQGDEYVEHSIQCIERYTPYSSSEFAVRPFIVNHEKRMLLKMIEWSKDENEHVRRLASEGCRPQLPWGQALTKYKKDPKPILQILEQLKADASLYVRKSVANNLNDISKNHPDLIIALARDWYGKNQETDWIVKHGCRTLLKSGNQEVLSIFGYQNSEAVLITDFRPSRKTISIGGSLAFSFKISVNEATKIRLEYGVYYVKSNGKRNRKVFKISEIALKVKESKAYLKKHAFVDLTTRKHYPGIHSIVLIVNGVEREYFDFELRL